MREHGLREQRSTLRRAVGWVVVLALTIAAIVASVGLVSGSFDETDARVIAMSLGFGVFSSFAGAGVSLRLRSSASKRALGSVAVVLAAVSFLLLLAALWVDDDIEGLWRTFGCVALASLAASHACLVIGGRRPSDSRAVGALVTASVALGCVDAFLGILPLAEVVEDVDEGVLELIGVLVIALLLTTVLPPIVRKLQSAPPAEGRKPPAGEDQLVSDLIAVADRIESLNAGNPHRGPEIRRECERLRALAHSRAR